MEESGSNATDSPSAPEGVEESGSSGSSLTLSLTPPLSDNPKEGDRSESSTISEHLSSVENDRSLHEIEVANAPADFSLLLHLSADERLSQEPKPPSLNSSFSNNSIISLNALERFVSASMEESNNVKSILEEILNNEQFKSDTESREESLDIFANVNLDDKLLNSYNLEKSADFNLINNLKSDSFNSYDEVAKRVRDFEELIAVKDSAIAALTSELDSFREMMSNPSSNSMGTSTTEYKQYQEECHNKIIEYHNALVHKDDLIQKLTESLHQSILNREELKQQGEHFKNEIAQLQRQLEETSVMLKSHKCESDKSRSVPSDLDAECSKLEDSLSPPQIQLFNEVKAALNVYVQSKIGEGKRAYDNEINNLKVKMEGDRAEHDGEIARLRDLLASVKGGSGELMELKQQLDAKHSKEMEELRTYFEKKCADLEKNYSEEVFSQQSRKMSGSSSCSELSSDFAFNQPGPGGDAKVDYTKKDVAKLREDLAQVLTLLDRYALADISDEHFEQLKTEIRKFDLRNLIRCDLAAMRAELQNKYHAELEILREDFDNRVDVLNVEHEKKLREVEEKCREEVEDLTAQLRTASSQIVSTSVQEVASSGEFEIDEVVQSYERRLQEQVTLAKIDIIAALESQIQRLAASESVDEDWPEELLQLKERFCGKYRAETARLKEEHQAEISRLKEEHVRNLNGALERARRRSLRDADSLSKGELELLRERDCLKKQTSTLRNLVGELLKYFTQCEDELNNTLVEELLRHGFEKSLTQLEAELDAGDSMTNMKRVHLAPNLDDLINLINNSAENDLEAIDLKGELGICLEKLRADANAILALTSNIDRNEEAKNSPPPVVRSVSLENKVSSLTRQLISETQLKNELTEQLNEAKGFAQSLESERAGLEVQLEEIVDKQKVLEADLVKARDKIAELIENGHREIVSEGYGEEGRKGVRGMVDAVAALVELQERARNVTERPSNVDQNLLHLIEDFARVGEKIVEEAKRDCDDLKQQIEAADKKYKVTCQFLEDQAAEREQERDEAQREIDALREQLRDREKDRASCERITSEVEQLELQLRDVSRLMEEAERRCAEAESERKEAVDKIYVLRDIIRDLEAQVESKSRAEEELRAIVAELEFLVKHQERSDDEEGRRSDAELSRDASHVHELRKHIGDLEGEVQRLRLSAEIAGSEGAIKQIRNHLCEFETTLDKRTRDLEGLHSAISTTSCSSPSEDMSIRDVVNPPVSTSVYEECEVPLQQLARLREKLVRHSRAEDAAVKRIRDLEMQVFTLRADLEECQGERDILKKQIADQLVLISSLQIRLDDQRIRAEHIEKQTNTSLEVRIYDLQNNIAALEEKIANRDKTIAQLNAIVEETKQRLMDRENELASAKEDEIIAKMQEQVELLRAENGKLKARINNEAQILPNLVENIISDKNSDIEMLREKLSESEKQLELYSSLSLDRSQLEALNRLRLSGVSFADLVGLEEPEQVRRMVESRNESAASILSLPHKRGANETVFLGAEPEISTIEKVEAPNLFYSLQVPAGRQNSTEKHVRFEDEVEHEKLVKLENELEKKNGMIEEYENRLVMLGELETKVEKLQASLEETEEALKKATVEFEREQSELRENEKTLKLELAAKRLEADEKEEQFRACQNEMNRLKTTVEDLEERVKRSGVKELELEERNREIEGLKEVIKGMEDELLRIKDSLEDKEKEIKNHEKTIKEMKEVLLDRECEIEVLNEDAKKCRDDIEKLEDQLKTLHNSQAKFEKQSREKDSELAKMDEKAADLNKELVHLQHLVAEKDKIINQISEDSKSLHVNLETIQSKMQEAGNVVDLGRRLREEQKKNWELVEEIHGLKAQLLNVDKKSIDEITGQVQRELDYSAYLDTTIINVVNDHASIEAQDIEALQQELKKQKSVNKELAKARNEAQQKLDELERKYEGLKGNVTALQTELAKERSNLISTRSEDGKLIEQMRIRLDSALNNEVEFEKILNLEKRDRSELEKQLASMKQKIALLSSSSKSESTEYKEIQDQEMRRLNKELILAGDRNEMLDAELRAVKQAKAEIDADLKYSQDLMAVKAGEVRVLEGKVEVLSKSENVLKVELYELREKLNEKTQQIENCRVLMIEMDEDRVRMKERIDRLNQKLKEAEQNKNKVDGDVNVNERLPDKLMEKIRELNVSVRNNIQMMDLITRLSAEKAVLEQRIVALENKNSANVPFDDPASRANYLFAKYLRSESYRKALIWQKRYLTSLLQTYQTSRVVNNKIPDFVTQPKESRSSGIERFKRVGLALVALARMKYLVRRWHSGKRIVQQRSASRVARFQVGQPVSSQNFASTAALSHENFVESQSALPNETLPRTGHSPPSKDVQQRSSPAPLTAPGLLAKYVERFNQIQERLNIASGPTPSS